MEWDWDNERVDQLEDQVWADEVEIRRLRARQVQCLRELDRYQVDLAEGARTMGDWVCSQLDLSHQTATRLMTIAKADDPEVDANLASGKWGLDRSALLVKLRQVGVTPKLFWGVAEKYSLGRLYGLLDRLRHLTPAEETICSPTVIWSSNPAWTNRPSNCGDTFRVMTGR